MSEHDYLVLNYDGFADRLNDFYTLLSNSPAAQAAFVRDPAGTIGRNVLKGIVPLSQNDVSQANRLLFSLLSNDGFMSWAETFQSQMEEEARAAAEELDPGEQLKRLLVTFDRSRMYREVVQAAVDNIDVETMSAITIKDPGGSSMSLSERATSEPTWAPNVRVEIETFVYAVFVLLVFAIDISFQVRSLPQMMSRSDLLQVAESLSQSVQRRAQELRAAGELLPFDPDEEK